MGLVIQNLLLLQEVDLQIISLNDEKTQLLDSIERKQSELEEKRQEFEGKQDQLKRIKLDMKDLEIELADAGERIRKLEGQQVQVKTNQEYKALDKEIYEAKAHQTRTEDLLLQKMEQLEQEKGQIQDETQQLGLQDAELERERQEAQRRIQEIEARTGELNEKRSRTAGTLEETHLRLYERIFNSNRTPVIVPLVNRTCQGCHLTVTAAIESILRRHQANIITCENCSRILYVPEDEQESD